MSIERNIFKKSVANQRRLLAYGFIENEQVYTFSKKIMNDAFLMNVSVKDNEVTAKVIDLDTDEEYTNFRMELSAGAFVGAVREAFENVLIDIRDKCFDSNYFVFFQSNEVTHLIKEKYGDEPEFLWEKNPGSGVFRNKNSQKWYGIIMDIDRSKLGDDSGEIEVINLKLPKEKINLLLQADGFYPAYHMNKKSWLSIILDGTVSTPYIMSLIEESYQSADTGKSSAGDWVIPANPRYYNVEEAFNHSEIITWHQDASMRVGNLVYIYVTSPISSIMYKCRVLDVELKRQDGGKAMRLQLVDRYKEGQFSLDLMKKYGVKSVRGARHISEELSKKINE